MKIVTIVLMCLVMTSCATLRTVNDAATILCNVFAEENLAELDGVSPADWCEVKEHLDPFVEYVLDVQGMSMEIQHD